MKALHLIFGATSALGGASVNTPTAERGGSGNNSRSARGRAPSSSSRDERPRRGGLSSADSDILDLDDIDGRSLTSSRGRGKVPSSSSGGVSSDLLDDDEPSFLLEDDLDSLLDGIGGGRDGGMMDDIDDQFDYHDSDGDDFDPLTPSEDEDDGIMMGDGLTGGGGGSGVGGADQQDEYGQGSEKGALYDAYNLLHSLAQVREREIDMIFCH